MTLRSRTLNPCVLVVVALCCCGGAVAPPHTDCAFARAGNALRKRRYATALRHLHASTEPRSVALRARILLKTGSFTAAARSFRIVGETSSAALADAMVLGLEAARSSLVRGRAGDAYNAVSKLLLVSIEAPRLYLLRAECALALNFFFAVQSDVARVLQNSDARRTSSWVSSVATSYRLLGLAHYRSLGNLEQGVALLERCLAIAPGHTGCGGALASLRVLFVAWRGAAAAEQRGDLAAAAAHLGTFIKVDPASPLRQRALTRRCALRREIALRSCFTGACGEGGGNADAGEAEDAACLPLCFVTAADPITPSDIGCPNWHSVLSIALMACRAGGARCGGIIEVGLTRCRGRRGCAARYELRAAMPDAPASVPLPPGSSLAVPLAGAWVKRPVTADAQCGVLAVHEAIATCEQAEDDSATLLRNALAAAEDSESYNAPPPHTAVDGDEAMLAAVVQIDLAWAAQQQEEWMRARSHTRAAKLLHTPLDAEKAKAAAAAAAEYAARFGAEAAERARERSENSVATSNAVEPLDLLVLRVACLDARQAEGEKDATELDDAALYGRLGLTPAATQSESKRAYFSLALRWHPDKHSAEVAPLKAHAHRRFLTVAEAYKTLKARWRGEEEANGEAKEGAGGGGGGGGGKSTGGFDWIFDGNDLNMGGWQTGFDPSTFTRRRVNVDGLRNGRWYGCARQHLCLPKRARFARRPPPPRATHVVTADGSAARGNASAACWNCTHGSSNASVNFQAAPSFASSFFLVEGGEPNYRCMKGVAAGRVCGAANGSAASASGRGAVAQCSGALLVELERGVLWGDLSVVACSAIQQTRGSWRSTNVRRRGEQMVAEDATCRRFELRVCSRPKAVVPFVV